MQSPERFAPMDEGAVRLIAHRMGRLWQRSCLTGPRLRPRSDGVREADGVSAHCGRRRTMVSVRRFHDGRGPCDGRIGRAGIEGRAWNLEWVKNRPTADRAIEAGAVKTMPETGPLTDPPRPILARWTTNPAAGAPCITSTAQSENDQRGISTSPVAELVRIRRSRRLTSRRSGARRSQRPLSAFGASVASIAPCSHAIGRIEFFLLRDPRPFPMFRLSLAPGDAALGVCARPTGRLLAGKGAIDGRIQSIARSAGDGLGTSEQQPGV